MITPDARIAELERLDAAATPGDWFVEPDMRSDRVGDMCDSENGYRDYLAGFNVNSQDAEIIGIEGMAASDQDEANAALIVAMRNSLPTLLAEHAAMKALTEPFKDFHGDLPDYDHPMRCVFESGIQYAVELLAKELGVEHWEVCDGTEEFDGDLGGTMVNIVCVSLPEDEHGDRMFPRDVHNALAAMKARVGALEDAVRQYRNDMQWLPEPDSRDRRIKMIDAVLEGGKS